MSALLLRPLAYLSIQHESGRLPWLNWGLPLAVAGGTLAIGGLIAPAANVFHGSGLLDKLLGFVQNMPGFYLAALAAVATFNRPDLDHYMPGTPPSAEIIYNGKPTRVDLTRRRFLTMMFAYLTALSIGITVCAIAALTLVDPVKAYLVPGLVPWARAAIALSFLAFTAQMIVITMWGLYYLGERMHTPDK